MHKGKDLGKSRGNSNCWRIAMNTGEEIFYGEYLEDVIATVAEHYPNSPLLDFIWSVYEELGYVSDGKDFKDLMAMQEEHDL